MSTRVIKAADLFCGAGGTSSGLRRLCEKRGYKLQLTAINHWDVAIATHSANHPEAEHLCASVDAVDPRKCVPGGYLDILVASPECTDHSIAKGGRPVSDQKRASAWLILRWIELLYVKTVLIENVKEFKQWGPVGSNGRPLKSKRGETFRAFVAALQSLGYRVEWRVLNAADYGDPTTRERLFIIAQRGNRKIQWPEPTHTKSDNRRLFGNRKKWLAARQIIDWNIPGQSIFTRKRPLAPATFQRILTGLERFGGKELQPFIVVLRNHGDARSIEEPVPTLCAGGNHIGVAEPFQVIMRGKSKVRSVDQPTPTGSTKGAHVGIAQPFILPHRMFKGMEVDSIERPLRTIRAVGSNITLVQPEVKPFLVPQFGEREGQKPRTHSIDEPLPAVTSHGAGAVVEPVLVRYSGNHAGKDDGSKRVQSIEDPVGTLDTSNRYGLAEPFLLQLTHGGRVHDIDKPVPTVTTAHRGETGIVSPLIAKYYGTGQCRPVDEPLDTISTKDRFGLVMPVINGYALDIKFRMLQPKELAAAMGFDPDYQFTGNREAVIKQIGNAVCVNVAQALCEAVLG